MLNKEKISLFPNIRGRISQEITLNEFIESVKGSLYEDRVTRYRQLVAEGNTPEAANVKRNLPAVSTAVQCTNGHSHDCITGMSGVQSLDFDGTALRTDEIFALLCALPYVSACIRTVSGSGVKPFIRIDAHTPEEFATAYPIVAAEVSSLVAHACDKQCSDATRLCFGTYDPGAFYRPDAEVFPWRERLGQEVPVFPPVPVADKSTAPADAFLNEFLQYNPFVRGDRHRLMLKLGRKAASKEFSEEEFENLIRQTCQKLAGDDYSEPNMRSDLLAGYQYVKTRIEKGEGSGFTLTPLEGEDDTLEKMLVLEKNQELQAALPYFPAKVYNSLPRLLQRCLTYMSAGRERDFLLMALLANLSACLPKVRLKYDRLEYSCHFYFAAVSGTASGKGVVAYAAQLSQPLHDYLYDCSMRALKEYKLQMRQYKLDEQQALSQKKLFTGEEPQEPRILTLQVPGNCSKAVLIDALLASPELGVVINVSEINTLGYVMGQDYGKMDDILCAAAHHERFGAYFKTNKVLIIIDEPRAAMSASGTIDQLLNLIHSQENGFLSRIGLLTSQAQVEFHSCEPREGVPDMRTYLREIGEEVLAIYKTLIEMPGTRVHFTPEQWARHTEYFQHCLMTVRFEGDEDVHAIVYRYGLLAMRLAALFTVLRKCEDKIYAVDRECSDEDFESAMAMIDVLIKHAFQITTLFPPRKGRKLNAFQRVLEALRLMSIEFTFAEFQKTMVHSGVPESTAKRWLRRSIDFQLVEKHDGKYRKTGLLALR